ncbi:MAG: lipocalin family protein [Cyanobium sp.]
MPIKRANLRLIWPLCVLLLGATANRAPMAAREVQTPLEGPQPAALPSIAPSIPPVVTPSVMPVASVNLERYAGVWRELAKIPNPFQRQCARDTLAQYTLRADGQLKVVNQCLTRNGILNQASGVARIVDPISRARLKVSLVSVLGWRPFWGDYWVIGLDESYRWAVVGTPDRRYGWVLARTRQLDQASWRAIAAILARNGYSLSSFVLDNPPPPAPDS